ncbi:MAG: hypothetical protein FIA89_12475 [Geobacter sp.]|jgi:hypothetical protein|nr:hypothetical protein [Geobacter sp.]
MKKTVVAACLGLGAVLVLNNGCVSTGGSAMETHTKGIESVTEEEYVVTKKPVDRHYIGYVWSKQFGPVEDTNNPVEIRVKKERSFKGVQQDFAFNVGLALGARPVAAPVMGEAGIQGGSVEKSKLEGLEIITPVNIADVPFEPDYNYITEALRLSNFRIGDEKSNKASIGVTAGSVAGSGTAVAEAGSSARRGTEGEGLVVAYRLQTIDKGSYIKKDSGFVPLQLDKNIDLPAGNVVVRSRLQTIEPGAGKSLPRNVLWACARANAMSRDMLAAWLVEVKPLDPKRKTLTIAFPAFPKVEECQNYSGVIFSRIDPLTDRIIRQKVGITVIDAEVNDVLKPTAFDARVTVSDESFKIKTVTPADL